jgi:gluconokinase
MIVVIMGVTGSGKTTVGSLLAKQLGCGFADADSFHPPANIEKMRQGIGLTDADRVPWLKAIHDAMLCWQAAGQNYVLACSALKEIYRQQLREGVEPKFVYLRGSAELIQSRLAHRSGHYAKADLLSSQFSDLQEPGRATVIEINHTPEEIVEEIRKKLFLA